MSSVLLKSEPVLVEVGDHVYWVKLNTRRVGPAGSAQATVQYWAFLPPGMRPSTLRGTDRDSLIAEVTEIILKQSSSE